MFDCKLLCTGNTCFLQGKFGFKTYCKDNLNCEHKQLEKARSCLDKIRDIKLESLDIDWDEYETQCRESDYSSIITQCEIGLGEVEE
jgi:hypothetical protein